MTHLFIDLSEYIPDPEVEAVDKAISILMAKSMTSTTLR
jgi:hypothetical protein